LHQAGRRYHDFRNIREEIVRETDRLTGTNKGLSHTPIHLKIFSPRVLPLTLVDLPGIARIPVGDQPEDIEDQIRGMCMEYISNPNAIILAVTSANQDLANSDALKLAQTVDPYGTRTVGVLTKLDLMDDGTDASEILLNRVIPLRRGYIAVVNRGQKDVNADLSIKEGLKKEEAYFRSHPIYGRDRTILSKCGTHRLAQHLNVLLMHHIRDVLPGRLPFCPSFDIAFHLSPHTVRPSTNFRPEKSDYQHGSRCESRVRSSRQSSYNVWALVRWRAFEAALKVFHKFYSHH
jgi:replication fork clamp-binding protein CrfC